MHSTDYEILVVSDGVNSFELCENCADGEEYQEFHKTPIFADSEMDRNPSCDQCGYTSFVFNPTSDCIDNWIAELRYFVTGNDQRRDQFDREFLDQVAHRIPFDEGGGWVISELYVETRNNEKSLLRVQ